MTLDPDQIARYSRQIIVPEIGAAGQIRLLEARIGIVGGGEAAARAAVLLGRAGIGRLDLIGREALLHADLGPDCVATGYARIADAPVGDVLLDLAGDLPRTSTLGRRAHAEGRPVVVGTVLGSVIIVATLRGRPCIACVDPGLLPPGEATEVPPPVAETLAALGASEVLACVLGKRDRSRVQTLGLDDGTASTADLAPLAGCPVCGGCA